MKKNNPYLLIYNPHAGDKRKALTIGSGNSIDTIKDILKKYQIPIDYAPTKHAGHATQIAQEAVKLDYKAVIVAGGDGTVGETANGLINSNIKLGIIPMGIIMNVCRMLCIPFDIEKAIMLLKIDRTRKIDVGCVTELKGKKVEDPMFFMESAGVGFDAQFQKLFKEYEDGNVFRLYDIVKLLFSFYKTKIIVTTDHGTKTVNATLVNVSNGPLAGAALQVALDSKLNDHFLTLALYKMEVRDLIWYFLKSVFLKNVPKKTQAEFIQSKYVKIESHKNLPLHIDARQFSKTPAEFKVCENALNVICGFPESDSSAFVPKSILDNS